MLDAAPEDLKTAIEWTLLRADVLTLKGASKEAESLLAKAREANPKEVGAWVGSILLAERRQAWEEVDRLMAEAAEHCGDGAALRLARVRQASARDADSVPRLLDELADGAEAFAPAERVRLWGGLLSIASAQKAHRQALALCQRLSGETPQDLEIRFVEINSAYRLGNADALKRAIGAVAKTAGQGALWHYGEAMRLELAAKGDQGAHVAALGHLAEARKLRPAWAPPLVASAAIRRIQGNLAQAADEYRQAIELGVDDPELVRSTVLLLHQQGKFDEAYQLLQRFETDQPGITLAMGRVGSELSLRHADLAAAVEAARRAAKDSSSPDDHLWLGQVLATAASRAGGADEASQIKAIQEAERSVRQGLALNRANPTAWVLLVRLLVATRRQDEAKTTIREAERELKGEGRLLALAECHRAAGQFVEAAVCYRDAAAERPRDPSVLRRAAEFSVAHGQLDEARELIERVLRLDGDVGAADRGWARRSMAVLFLQDGGYRNLLQGIALVDQNLESPQAVNEDRCVKALLLASHPQREERRRAVRILEEVLRQDRSLTRYRLLAADVYRRLGDWGGEARQMRNFLASNPSHRAALANYVRGMLKHNELNNAAEWLDRLDRIAPQSQETVHLRLVWLLKRGKYDDVVARLRTIRSGKQEPDSAGSASSDSAPAVQLPELLRGLAPTVAECRQDPKATPLLETAEKMLRELAALDASEAMALAGWLGVLGRPSEGIDLVERHWPKAKPASLEKTLLDLRTASRGNEELAGRLLALLDKVGRKVNWTVELLTLQAELEDQLGRYAAAEKRYREAIRKEPRNIVACNNLAVLLALQKKDLDEALTLVAAAIDRAGPLATLRDTLAVVQLARGEPQEAIREVDAAIADEEMATSWFHRAQACQRLGRTAEAAEALKKAEELAGGPVEMHKLEEAEYEQLRAAARQ